MNTLLGAILVLVAGLSVMTESGWAEMSQAAVPLKMVAGSKAEASNNKGLEQFAKKDWNKAKSHFQESVKADPKSAEAHYNLALVLDKTEDHEGATEHFKQAQDLGKSNPEIQNSGILKEHLTPGH